MPVGRDDAALRGHLAGQFSFPARIGVAVSGGSDSMALLDLFAQLRRDHDLTLLAATVDHGLRPEAAAEAAAVATWCAARDIAHTTLRWTGWDGAGNLQAAARNARYRLLARWGADNAVTAVALAHTEDDQAETLLMRLARAAGVDGLSGMPARFDRHGTAFARPLLAVSRRALRDYLTRRGISWAEDPSNDDAAYERIRARRVLASLHPLGIDATVLAEVADQIGAARQVLDHVTAATARTAVIEDRGDLLVDMDRLAAQPPEIARRLFAAALRWVGGSGYPPRREDLARLLAALAADSKQTLAGCLIERRGKAVRIIREAAAAKGQTATDDIWDNRWQIEGPHHPALHVAALGETGLAACPDWRASGLPRATLLASPAIWRGETLVAAPLAGLENGWTARIVADFAAGLLVH